MRQHAVEASRGTSLPADEDRPSKGRLARLGDLAIVDGAANKHTGLFRHIDCYLIEGEGKLTLDPKFRLFSLRTFVAKLKGARDGKRKMTGAGHESRSP